MDDEPSSDQCRVGRPSHGGAPLTSRVEWYRRTASQSEWGAGFSTEAGGDRTGPSVQGGSCYTSG